MPERTVRIHYERADQQYEGWSAWVWGDVAKESQEVGSWPDGATDATDIGRYGAYYDIELKEGAESFGFLFVNKQGEGQTSDYTFDKINQFNHLFIKHGDPTIYPHPFGSMPLSLHSGELLSDKKLRLVFQKRRD
ncbi:pullulanase-associated domain-containing protein [Caldalkalibacillus mannanilyticus]|uniref:pullulanase-associated domain-containing protein n=1 Tax=Caldalkalibacillus mannanilyticus TaxID=1418 RepID=UPI000A89F9C5|nr:pullulanase-associated domain-containing protein [Caldalkalibacillus mannanilyticus]